MNTRLSFVSDAGKTFIACALGHQACRQGTQGHTSHCGEPVWP
ncbi:MAG: hypothetical protein OXE42_11930 [Gammaproteobacteria bacterium]|nr:hypothetical protein [Gammaproteobacteria bacterium]